MIDDPERLKFVLFGLIKAGKALTFDDLDSAQCKRWVWYRMYGMLPKIFKVQEGVDKTVFIVVDPETFTIQPKLEPIGWRFQKWNGLR